MPKRFLPAFAASLVLTLLMVSTRAHAVDDDILPLFKKYPRTHFCPNSRSKGVIYPFQNYLSEELTLIGSAAPQKLRHLITNPARYQVAIDPKTEKATVMLQAVNYLENSIGHPYQELIVYIQVKERGEKNPLAYVAGVFPNEPLALVAGKTLGLKGKLAETNYQLSSSSKEVRLSLKGDVLFAAQAHFPATKEKGDSLQGEDIFVNSEGNHGRIAYSERFFQRAFDPVHDMEQLGDKVPLFKSLRKADFKPVSWIYNPTSSFVVMNGTGAPRSCLPLPR